MAFKVFKVRMSNPIERPCIVYMNDCRDCKDVTCIEEKVSGKERKNIWKAVYFRQADVICPRERSLVFTKYRKHRPFSVFKGFHVHISMVEYSMHTLELVHTF